MTRNPITASSRLSPNCSCLPPLRESGARTKDCASPNCPCEMLGHFVHNQNFKPNPHCVLGLVQAGMDGEYGAGSPGAVGQRPAASWSWEQGREQHP